MATSAKSTSSSSVPAAPSPSLVSWAGLSIKQIRERIELDAGIISGEREGEENKRKKRKFYARQRIRRQKKWTYFERIAGEGDEDTIWFNFLQEAFTFFTSKQVRPRRGKQPRDASSEEETLDSAPAPKRSRRVLGDHSDLTNLGIAKEAAAAEKQRQAEEAAAAKQEVTRVC